MFYHFYWCPANTTADKHPAEYEMLSFVFVIRFLLIVQKWRDNSLYCCLKKGDRKTYTRKGGGNFRQRVQSTIWTTICTRLTRFQIAANVDMSSLKSLMRPFNV
ncbi:conserved hypothetical protein [Trichinella spiralis]|uniref:hypothetical protein n=1 Tax=Trichinella spiralis TaxID=6334 RepID=UPI0001EFB5DD|nr:conserved hypothetical protein [Trichinella spiralis]